MDFPIGIGINVKGSREAVDLYQKAFGFTLGYHVLTRTAAISTQSY